MAEVFSVAGAIVQTGGDAALIAIAAAIYKLDRRLSMVEMRLDFLGRAK